MAWALSAAVDEDAVSDDIISKVVQIEISRTSDFWHGQSESVIALCEDGSIWRLVKKQHLYSFEYRWVPIPLKKYEGYR